MEREEGLSGGKTSGSSGRIADTLLDAFLPHKRYVKGVSLGSSC